MHHILNHETDDKQSARTPCHHLETVPEDDVSQIVVRYKLCLEVAVTVWTATPWYVPV